MFILMLLFLASSSLFAQVSIQPQNSIPDRFDSIVLGAPLETVKLALQNNTFFNYRGDPDVSLAPIDRQPIIVSLGLGFMEEGVFQFKDERLYSITLRIDKDQIDYFTMYDFFSEKYGDPNYLDPQQSYWEQEGRRMVLERPVVVKYLDMDVFNRIREEGVAVEAIGEYSRELFLDSF